MTDFELFKAWCKQNSEKPHDANVLRSFVKGLPLWENDEGELLLDDENIIQCEDDYCYDFNAWSESNQKKYECQVRKVLENERRTQNEEIN